MKILVVGPAWVGDMMMAHVLFQLLSQKHPNAEIHVLAPEWSEALLSRMPEVSKRIVLPFSHGQLQLKKRYQFAKTLRAEKYDHAFVTPNSLKSALIPWWARIPKRTGYVGECRFGLLNDARVLNKKQFPMMTERFAALAYHNAVMMPANLPIPVLYPNPKNTDEALEKYHLKTDKPILILCPGAEFGPSKCWPAHYYAAVAHQKLNEGWAVWLFGSEKDRSITDDINTQTQNRCANLAGKTSLADAVDLMALAKTVVTNDSGLMHIACALDRRVIALYGSTSPDFTPPLSDKATVLKLTLDCQPCFERKCPLGHHRCLRDLLPAQVLSCF